VRQKVKKLTLDEIGKLAGVSRATVSRVVNGYPHIRPELRERVQKVIEQTGFQPNAVARSLASNTSHIIGLFVPNVAQFIFADPYLTALIPGISQACNAHEYTLALFLFHTAEEEQKQFKRILGTGMIDGLIITADRRENEFMPPLLENGLPFVLMGRPANQSYNISYVDSDNRGGAYLGVKHLIRLGHKRIGIITTNLNTAADDRTEGYRQALAEQGIKFYPELFVEGDFTEASGYAAMRQLIPHRPDAVFTASDTMATGALRALREANIAVPDDIAVVSFDDLPSAAHTTPPLTTVRQPIARAGSLAVETLLDIIETGNSPTRRIILPTELVVRASCGAVQAVSSN
jgi:LacI family transcriptional regulator